MQAPNTPAIPTTDHFLHIASLNYSEFIPNSFSRYLSALRAPFSKQKYHSQQAGNKDSHPEFFSPKPWLLEELEKPWETTQPAHIPLMEHLPYFPGLKFDSSWALFIDSQNGLGGKGSLKAIQPNPCSQQGHELGWTVRDLSCRLGIF